MVKEKNAYFVLMWVCLVCGFVFVRMGFFEYGLFFGVLSVWFGQDVNQCELLEKLG